MLKIEAQWNREYISLGITWRDTRAAVSSEVKQLIRNTISNRIYEQTSRTEIPLKGGLWEQIKGENEWNPLAHINAKSFR